MKKLVIIAGVCLLLSVVAIVVSSIMRGSGSESYIEIPDWDTKIHIGKGDSGDITIGEVRSVDDIEYAVLHSKSVGEVFKSYAVAGEVSEDLDVVGLVARSKDSTLLGGIGINSIIPKAGDYYYTIDLIDIVDRTVNHKDSTAKDTDKQKLNLVIERLSLFDKVEAM